MTLENPTLIERIITNKRWIIYAVLALVLIAAGLFIKYSWDTYIFNRGVKKDKAAIANNIGEIANISNQIANLQQQKVAKQTEVNIAIQDFTNSVDARETAKKETNLALGNFQRAVNANTNVDVTAEDLKKKLEELEKQ